MFKSDFIELLKEEALEYGDFTLKSGKKSHFYLDVRKVTLCGAGLQEIVKWMNWTGFKEFSSIQAIGGPSIGADPIVGGFLQTNRSFRGFLIRPEAKDHGKKDLVIGSVRKGDHVVVVEDVTTTGGSLIRAIEIIQDFGCVVDLALTVVDREDGASEALEKLNIPFYSFVTLSDLNIQPMAENTA